MANCVLWGEAALTHPPLSRLLSGYDRLARDADEAERWRGSELMRWTVGGQDAAVTPHSLHAGPIGAESPAAPKGAE